MQPAKPASEHGLYPKGSGNREGPWARERNPGCSEGWRWAGWSAGSVPGGRPRADSSCPAPGQRAWKLSPRVSSWRPTEAFMCPSQGDFGYFEFSATA